MAPGPGRHCLSGVRDYSVLLSRCWHLIHSLGGWQLQDRFRCPVHRPCLPTPVVGIIGQSLNASTSACIPVHKVCMHLWKHGHLQRRGTGKPRLSKYIWINYLLVFVLSPLLLAPTLSLTDTDSPQHTYES